MEVLVQVSFTRHRYELPTLCVFFLIALVELFAVHLLVSLWSSYAAWVLSALTMVMLGQIGLLVHGMVGWPTLLDNTGITVRHGRKGEIFVPLKQILNIENVAFRPEEKGLRTFRATVLAQPNIAIRLSQPLDYGQRTLSSITMRLDEPDAFIAAVLSARKGVTVGEPAGPHSID